jgi:general stress protein 26
MPSQHEIEGKFWDALTSDMTVMLGIAGQRELFPHPMTAQVQADKGLIWFFSSTDNQLVRRLDRPMPALFTFAAKGHDLFATVEGRMLIDSDRAVIDRLWNKYVAAWYEKGKDDPKLALLRFEPGHAEIWLDEKTLFAGIKLLLGVDPKKDYKNKVAEVNLS